MAPRFLTFILVVASLAVPCAARAADTPSYATSSDQQTIHGVITAFHGKYDVNLRDEHGYVDRVELHQGTIINPTGLPLQQGMSVTVVGRAEGDVFAANEIDAPVNYVVFPYHDAFGPWWGGGFGYRSRGFHGRFGR